MRLTPSPLRYPGGKTSLIELITTTLANNSLDHCTYAEPFAGGGGLALSLLFGGFVQRIILNDLDRAIWAFWDSALNDNENFVNLIQHTPVTITEWHQQREVYLNPDRHTTLELGFATFFLNRTNRSGVIKAGVIGGKSQESAYKLDCRFNKSTLIAKIERIHKYRGQIELHCLDGQEFLTTLDRQHKKLFFFIDPPYFQKGAGLYTNFYVPEDHAELAQTVRDLGDPWLLTYDWAEEIRELYKDFQQYEFGINYSASVKRVGQELLVTSPTLSINNEIGEGPLKALGAKTLPRPSLLSA